VSRNLQTLLHRCVASVVCLVFIAQFALAQSAIGLRLQIVQGDRSQNVIGRSAAVPISVRVTDRSNRPVSGATVVLTAPDKGASGDFDGQTSFRLMTNEEGLAVVRNYRPNRVEGRYPILVQADYLGELATGIMVQTNAVGKKSHGKMIAIAAAAGGAVGIAMAARGGGGSTNPSTPSTLPTITFGGAPTVTGPR
jgi:hypothetical protein